jgi:hypothetical protein
LLIQNREYGNGQYAWVNVSHENVYEPQGQQQTSTAEALPQSVITQPFSTFLVSDGIAHSSNSVASFPNMGIKSFLFDTASNANLLNSNIYGPFNTQPMNVALPDNNFVENPVIDLDPQIITASSLHRVPKATSRKTRHRCQWSTCTKDFSRQADLERHINTVHLRAKVYYCPVYRCPKSLRLGKPYSRLDKLQEHMRLKHGNGGNLIAH